MPRESDRGQGKFVSIRAKSDAVKTPTQNRCLGSPRGHLRRSSVDKESNRAYHGCKTVRGGHGLFQKGNLLWYELGRKKEGKDQHT